MVNAPETQMRTEGQEDMRNEQQKKSNLDQEFKKMEDSGRNELEISQPRKEKLASNSSLDRQTDSYDLDASLKVETVAEINSNAYRTGHKQSAASSIAGRT